MKWNKETSLFNFRFQIHKIILIKSLLISVLSITLLNYGNNFYLISKIEITDLVISTLSYFFISLKIWKLKSINSALFLFFELNLFIIGYWIIYLLCPIEEFIYYRIVFREFPLILLLGHIATKDALLNIREININSRLSEMKSEIYRLIFRFLPLNSIALILSPLILNSYLDTKCIDMKSSVSIYLLLVIARIIFTENLLNALNQKRILAIASILQSLTTIVLGIGFTKYLGSSGMAISLLVAIFIAKIFTIFKLNSMKISLEEYFPTTQYLIFTVLLIMAFIFVEFEII